MTSRFFRTQKLVSNLVALRISGTDLQFMDTLVRSVFGRYLETYSTYAFILFPSTSHFLK